MSETTTVAAQSIMSEDEVLQYTHGVRKAIVDKITDNGQKIPAEDPKLLHTILATLDGMDRSALGRKKIQSEEKLAGANQAMAAGIIATVLQQVGSGHNLPFTSAEGIERAIPVLGNDVPEPVLVDGEIDTNAPQQSFESFQRKFEPLNEDE